MISCINLLRKDPAIDQEAFRAFLEDDYAQLCMRIPHMHEYEQNYVTLKEQGDASSEAIQADAFTIERYETLYDYETARASREYAEVLCRRVDAVTYNETYVCRENVSIPLHEPGASPRTLTQ